MSDLLRNRKRYLFVVVLLLSACAHIVDPGGGPKDEKAPVVIGVFPRPNSTNTKPKEVVITFDEYLRVGPMADQVFISPVPSVAPEISIQGKQIRILFRSPLLENTTYSITVAGGIRDFTEGNPISNPIQVAFSTGSVIDTGVCRGKLRDPVLGTPLPGWNVGLFAPAHGDSVFAYLGQKPIYLTRSDAQGTFELPNLKSGSYYIQAYKDKDQNMAPDSLELLALCPGSGIIHVPADTAYILDFIPVAYQGHPGLRAEFVNSGVIRVEFNRPLVFSDSTMLVFPSDSSGSVTGDALPVMCLPGGKVTMVYFDPVSSTHLYFPTVLDSAGTIHAVTVKIPPSTISKKPLMPTLAQVKYNPLYAELLFSHPPDPSGNLPTGGIVRGNSIRIPKPETDTIVVRLPMGMRFLQTSDTLVRDTTIRLIRRMFPDPGALFLDLDKEPGQNIRFWLQASDGTVSPGTRSGRQVVFSGVLPGKYFIYLLEDLDMNSVRTLPTLRQLPDIQPERMIRVTTPVEIRPNWDLEGIKVSIPW